MIWKCYQESSCSELTGHEMGWPWLQHASDLRSLISSKVFLYCFMLNGTRTASIVWRQQVRQHTTRCTSLRYWYCVIGRVQCTPLYKYIYMKYFVSMVLCAWWRALVRCSTTITKTAEGESCCVLFVLLVFLIEEIRNLGDEWCGCARVTVSECLLHAGSSSYIGIIV